jgi:hypothetical protein
VKKLAIHVVMDDGTTYDAVSRSADYVAYEAEARKRGWGTISESPSSWEAFISYRALIRTRAISMPFDQFLASVDELNASPLEDAEAFPKDLSDASSSS